MAGLINSAAALRALNGMRSEIGVVNDTYDLLEFDDVDGNIKMIGDKIIDKIKKNYIDGNPNNTPEKIKAQIKLDALTIYYENSGDRKVKKNIKEKVCQAWYGALKTRIEKIMKEVVLLLNKEDVAKPTETTGGGGSASSLLGKMNSLKQLSDIPNSLDAANALKNVSSNGMSMDLLTGVEPQLKLTEKEKEEQAKTNAKNNLYLEKLIEYKSKLFEIENFEKRPLNRSATVSQVYSLHEGIISKILCNYAVINRDILVGELRKSILGKSAIAELDDYNRNNNVWSNSPENANADEKQSVYQSFITKLRSLGDKENRNKSKPIGAKVSTPTEEEDPEKTGQKGGKVDKKIPEYIPSTYIWERIKGYVEERLQILIQEKMSLNKENTEGIKKGFQEVFLQANCDSLDLVSPENKEMTEMLNQEYHRMLDYLCKNIPDKYAAPILQSYILRNFEEFTTYLATVFKEDAGIIESFFLGYRNVPSKMFEDADVKPVYPEIKREVVPKDADYDVLDNCCDKREGDKDLDATGVSDYIHTKNIGKEQSIKDQFTPSILLPAFNVFKKEFNECSENEDFLAILFNMYSGKSIKFVQQIQQQFSHDGVNDFIERYILTKHPYTTKIIAECIKHVSDIKITLSKTAPIVVDEDGEVDETKKTEFNNDLIKLVSQYAAFLMHSGSILSPKIDTTVQNAYVNYLENTLIPGFTELFAKYNQNTEFAMLDIKEGIIGRIPDQEKGSYNKALRTIFNANKSILSSARKFTRKLRVGLDSKKRYVSSLFSKNPESKETTETDNLNEINDSNEPNGNEAKQSRKDKTSRMYKGLKLVSEGIDKVNILTKPFQSSAFQNGTFTSKTLGAINGTLGAIRAVQSL